MQVVHLGHLWEYYEKKGGLFTVNVRLSNFKNTEYIKTGYSSSLANWDKETGFPVPTHPHYKALTQKIKEIQEDIEFEIKLAKKNGETISIQELKARVDKTQKKEVVVVQKKPQVKILEFYDTLIKECAESDRTGTEDLLTYNKSVISRRLLNGKDKTFAEVTVEEFKNLEAFINTLKTDSTKSSYLRTFYRLWNIATERGFCSKEYHPKFFIKYQAYKRIRTKKRAIKFDYIKEIDKLEYDYSSRLFRSKLIALFSFYTRGMNWKDMLLLKRDINIKNGYCKYKRSKNGREYDFEAHPKVLEIVEIFRNYPMQSEAGYLFPILDVQHDTARKRSTRVKSALKQFNADLLEIEKAINAPKHITSYTFRHSFATNLDRKKVNRVIIKEAMGHETEEQLNTYLEDVDDTEIAEAILEAFQ